MIGRCVFRHDNKFTVKFPLYTLISAKHSMLCRTTNYLLDCTHMVFVVLYCCGLKTFLVIEPSKLVEVSLSDVASLLSGVIQGSGIGVVLFLAYINELVNIHVKLFADDVKLYLQITNDADVGRLQCAIDALTYWADESQLSVTVNKCCMLNIGRVICNTNLTINRSVLPTVESAHDLGVTVTQCFSFITC